MTATVHGRRTAPETEAAPSGEFVVPSSAVFAGDEGKQYVWVVDPADNTIAQRGVTLGEVTGTGSVKVLSGLSAGDRIATAGVTQLREGVKIRPTE
jgi:multidrug efflux pump subunit AcrA (membrane-fusion protein)